MKAALCLAPVALWGAAALAQAPPAPATPVPTVASGGPDSARLAAARKVVEDGWRLYDEDSDGALSPLEFGTWVMSAQGQVPARNSRRGRWKGPSSAAVLNATSAAFAKADADGDRAVSRDELIAFLAG